MIHHTWKPTKETWAGQRSIDSLKKYYEKKGWPAGPHIFVAEDGINQLEKVRQQMPEYEHGGASRTLGLLYTKAPGWSPFGDRGKAVFFAKESTKLAPEYLLNRVYLAEAYQKDGNKKAAIQELQKILSNSPTNNPLREKARIMLAEIE